MSQKNHIITARGVICTDKRFSDLKMGQREKINEWLYEEYAVLCSKNNLPLDSRYNNEILLKVQDKIEQAEIWLPFQELKKYFYSRKNKFRKRFEKANTTKYCKIGR